MVEMPNYLSLIASGYHEHISVNQNIDLIMFRDAYSRDFI